jgi:hypothetical protein
MMTRGASYLVTLMCFTLLSLVSVQGKSTRLIGKTGVSSEYGSGWLDISPTDFAKGDHLVITLGGTATTVVVRLLPKGYDPGKPDVVIAERISVRADRSVDVALGSEYKNIVQVSVHGGPNPWNQFPLGAGNGPATLISVQRVTP